MRYFLTENRSNIRSERRIKKSFLKKNRDLITGIAGLIFLAAMIIYFTDPGDFFQKNTGKLFGSENLGIIIPKVARSASGEIANDFPSDINLNGKIGLIESYSATYPNSPAKQATVEFISSKNPASNYDFYLKWAEDNEWQIVNSAKGQLVSSLYFKKTLKAINITIRPSEKATGGSNVIISHVDLNQ